MAIEDGEKEVDFAAEGVHEEMFPRFAVTFAVNRGRGNRQIEDWSQLKGRAEEVGFEPTRAIHPTRFPVVLTRPL